MATTWIKAIHRTTSNSILSAIEQTVEYAQNFAKTRGGELIAAYGCSPVTAASEFMLSKRLYEQRTGRNQGWHDVVGYQIRQSFKPGEVTAEQALDIGYKLAMRWTKGRHQFIVTAHTNTNNPHTHIFYNSVTLDCAEKFQDFKHSAIALRRISDMLCLEHGLSIIEKPKLSKGYNRNEYLGERRPKTGRDNLRDLIDNSLCAGDTFDGFLGKLRDKGCGIKSGKQYSIKPPGSKKFFRLDTLGDDYSFEEITKRLSDKSYVPKRRNIEAENETEAERKAQNYAAESRYRPGLLFDIQEKIRSGVGEGYVQWMRIFNLKESAKTLIWLKENGIDSYDDLCKKTAVATEKYKTITVDIDRIKTRQSEINELQKFIGQYRKTKEIYVQYRASGWSKKFYNEHAGEIEKCKDAKKYFDSLGYGKDKRLPTINSLRQEWSVLDAEKRKLYSGYKQAKNNYQALATARANADWLLFDEKKMLRTSTNPRGSIMEQLHRNQEYIKANSEKTRGVTHPSIGDSR